MYAPGFLDRFLESHAVMLQGNSDLKVKEGEVSSRPWQWPINYRVNFLSIFILLFVNVMSSLWPSLKETHIFSAGAILLREQPKDIFTRQSCHLVGEHSLPRNIHNSLRSRFRAWTTGLCRRCRRARATEQNNARRQMALPRVDITLCAFLGDGEGVVLSSLFSSVVI